MSKMRLGWYAGVSTALAGAVIISAFQQRANFYSAMVYLAQSNFCLLALVNFTLLIYSSFIYGLTRICYGNLRAVEVEQLTERAWFAITETCLAMTIFREEIGAWFLVMFTALVTGKVWGWIGDGRVEFLEQQPPANPRLFHLRLSVSLAMSFIYDVLILEYTVKTVIQKARPNMMVMFLFEFAVLATCSWRTGVRYILSLAEQNIVRSQTKQRLMERRREVREQREAMLREREHAVANGREPPNLEPLPNEEDIDEIDIEVPGWAAKGEWVLWLDLITDMIKLGIYVAFFFMLLRFYGLPIHIMRDLFMTSRDFIKRLNALLRYRRAIQEMNKYPDATADELTQENTCIICREEMRPWDPANHPGAIDKVRPKKLPCGHVLHLGCLKSWLERQQVCPTCRSPVTTNRGRGEQNRAANLGIQLGGQPRHPVGQHEGGGNNGPVQHQDANDGQRPARGGAPRVFNLGPIRLGFGANAHQARELAQQFGIPDAPTNQNEMLRPTPTQNQPPSGDSIQRIGNLLQQTEQIVQTELQNLQAAQQELQVAHLLMAEMQRLRQRRQQQLQQDSSARSQFTNTVPSLNQHQHPQNPQFNTQAQQHFPTGNSIAGIPPRIGSPFMTRHGVNGPTIPAGSPDLPDGVVLPPGWSLIPLQRLDTGHVQSQQQTSSHPAEGPMSSEASQVHNPITGSTTPPIQERVDRENRDVGTAAVNRLQELSAVPETGPSTLRLTPVVAPSPLLPSWSGPAQLFTNQSRPETLENPPSANHGADLEATEAQGSEVVGQEPIAGCAKVAGDGCSLQKREESSDPESSEGTPDKDKGKGRAVTIEDVGDDA